MSTKRCDWKRYWIPKDKKLPLDADGFLTDPQESPTFGWSQTNDAIGFGSLIKAPCLVLLGEPGMGKSDTVKMAEALTGEAVKSAGGQFEARLQGPDPLAELLWNDDSPKTERVMSTWVASELRRDLSADGILLNREVVIRSEDRLDILVEANCRDAKTDPFRQIRVIVEVKRDFNAGIDHAMETQLSQQYLSDNNCRTGLYLVAWFNRNRQRGEKAQERLKDFRAKLDDQAAKLSMAGKNLRAWVLDCSLLRQTEAS